MPVLGLTSLADKWNGNVTFSFNAVGFSVKSEINDNGYERSVSYLSVKMNAEIPSVSEFNDTYWVTRGALLLSDSLENVWEEPFNNGVFMETLYKDVPGAGTKSYYDIVQSDPEKPCNFWLYCTLFSNVRIEAIHSYFTFSSIRSILSWKPPSIRENMFV